MVASVQQRLGPYGLTDAEARRRAVAIVATMAGALTLARAVPDDDPLAHEILAAGLEGCLAEALLGVGGLYPPPTLTSR